MSAVRSLAAFVSETGALTISPGPRSPSMAWIACFPCWGVFSSRRWPRRWSLGRTGPRSFLWVLASVSGGLVRKPYRRLFMRLFTPSMGPFYVCGLGQMSGVIILNWWVDVKSENCKIDILEQRCRKRRDLYMATLHNCIPLGNVRNDSDSKKRKELTMCEVLSIHMSSSRRIWRVHVEELRYELDRRLRTNINRFHQWYD